jgi:hypothetical protein
MRYTAPTSILIALLTLGLAGLIGAGPAWSAPQTLSLSAKKKKPRPPRQEAGQIACTIVGCIRIPPKCHPEMGYTSDGTPTGFEIVVCPGKPPLFGNPL